MISFFLSILAVITLIWLGFFFWKKRTEVQLRDASDYEWDLFQKNDPAFVDHLDQESFYRVFHRAHFPRFPLYAAACISTFLLSLPVTFAVLVLGIWTADRLGWLPQPAEIANRFLIEGDSMRLITQAPSEAALYYVQDLGGFYYFFGVLAVWLLIVGVFTRHFHKNRPGYLRDEIIRSR